MEIKLHTFLLQLKRPFRISHGIREVQPTLIVELHHQGISGYGEATATNYYGLTLEKMVATMKSIIPKISSIPIAHPEQYYHDILPFLNLHPFLRCALDVAANDWWGKFQNKPLHEIWYPNIQRAPMTNYTIGLGSQEEMIDKIKEFPWPIYKIKLGGKDDIQTISAIRKYTSSKLRIDANTGWNPQQAFALIDAMVQQGVEMIEQPLTRENDPFMSELKNYSPIPMVADESCQIEEDVEKCATGFDGINIKLMKCGGLTPARKMIKKAKELNLKVMVGCMTESSIGIAAIAQLLPALNYVDMDGPLLIKNDPGKTLTMKDGWVTIPQSTGTGAVLLNANPV